MAEQRFRRSAIEFVMIFYNGANQLGELFILSLHRRQTVLHFLLLLLFTQQ